jgi:hypothetical protein
MQPGHPGHPFRQPRPRQPPPPRLILQLDIVVIFGPVIPNQQHIPSLRSLSLIPCGVEEEHQRPNGSVLTPHCGPGRSGRAIGRHEACDHSCAGVIARAGALGEGALGAGHPLRRPRDRWRWPGLIADRLRGGGSAVRATVAAFRRGGPAAQALAAAGSGRGQRRVRRHAGGAAVPVAAATPRNPAVDRKLGLSTRLVPSPVLAMAGLPPRTTPLQRPSPRP